MTTLAVDNLTKHYGAISALEDVSFRLEAGEIFGYLGPNGAGKTTTLRIILGLVRASHGSVHLLGTGSMGPSIRERIGYLPGEVHLYGSMTGEAVLDYFAGFRPHRPPLLREQLLSAFDLRKSDLTRRIKFLSHGTKQKIGLLIAMQHDPELLLLDEPTNGLDPLVQNSFRDIILDFSRRGRSIFLSSHILSEIEEICGRIAMLRMGKLIAVESIQRLRGNMVRRLQVRFRGPIPGNLEGVPGVTRVVVSGRDVSLWIRGDVNPILRIIATAEVDHFVFPEPELEEIFLGYYQTSA